MCIILQSLLEELSKEELSASSKKGQVSIFPAYKLTENKSILSRE